MSKIATNSATSEAATGAQSQWREMLHDHVFQTVPSAHVEALEGEKGAAAA